MPRGSDAWVATQNSFTNQLENAATWGNPFPLAQEVLATEVIGGNV
jgi:hypothetical protein